MMTPPDQFGAYEIRDTLGRGAMGMVYRACHELTRREVALKVLFPNVTSTEMGEERFKREVRVSAMVDHDGIVEVLDAGKEEEEFFYAMELLEGHELSDLLETCRWREGLAYLIDVTDALAACHEAGVIHRDLKPENIFVIEEDEGVRTKLLDFGMANVRESNRATQTGFTLGTPSYMSPEQAMDATEAGPESDVWSIGVILYEIIAGRLPFEGDSSTQVMLEVIEEEPPPLNAETLSAPAPLIEVIDRCLKKDPEARFPNARVLHDALLAVHGDLDDPPELPTTSALEPTQPSDPSPVSAEREALEPEASSSLDESDMPATEIDDSDQTERVTTFGSLQLEGDLRPWGASALAIVGVLVTGVGLAFIFLQYTDSPSENSESPSSASNHSKIHRTNASDMGFESAMRRARRHVTSSRRRAYLSIHISRALDRARRAGRRAESRPSSDGEPSREVPRPRASARESRDSTTNQTDERGRAGDRDPEVASQGAAANAPSEGGRPSDEPNTSEDSEPSEPPTVEDTTREEEKTPPESPANSTSNAPSAASPKPDAGSNETGDAGSSEVASEHDRSESTSSSPEESESSDSTRETASESTVSESSEPSKSSSSSESGSDETSSSDNEEAEKEPPSFF